MRIHKHLLVLGTLIAFAATFWLQTPTQAAPPDVRLSLTCYPQNGLVATFAWVPNAAASGQWVDLNRQTNTGEVYEGVGYLPATVNSHAMPVYPFSVYTVRIAEYVAVSDAWATSPTFYFETGACAPGAGPAPACTFPLCGGGFGGTAYGAAPIYGGVHPVGAANNYPAFPPTIAQYPVPGNFVPGATGYPGGCHPSYVGACVPVGTGDFDCKHGIGWGPNIVGHEAFYVVGPDTYGLDTNGDGVACNAPPEIFHAPPPPCYDHWNNNGWWGDHGDWHDDWDHDGWDDKDWDHHDWDNNHDKWGHDNSCFADSRGNHDWDEDENKWDDWAHDWD